MKITYLPIVLIGFLLVLSCKRSASVSELQHMDEVIEVAETLELPLEEVFAKHELAWLGEFFETKERKAAVIAEGVYAADLQSTKRISGFDYGVSFFGTPDDLKRLGAELKFIEEASRQNGFEETWRLGKQVQQGAKDAVMELFEFAADVGLGAGNVLNPAQLWSEAARQRRRDVTAKLQQLGESAGSLIEVVKQCDFEREKIKEVFDSAFEKIWSTQREQVANEYGFTHESIRYSETTYPILDTRTKARFGGRLLPEILLLAVPMSKVSHASKIKGGDKIADASDNLRAGKIIRYDNPFARSAQVCKARVETGFVERCRQFQPLVDPAKLRTLTAGNRVANRRFKKLHAHIYDIKQRTGKSYEDIVDRVYSGLDETGIKYRDFVYAPKTEKKNLVSGLKSGEKYGLNSVENIAKMRKGESPNISKGADAGKSVHVDHILPVAKAPELENSMANLRWLPSDQNLSKGKNVTLEGHRLIDALKDEVDWEMEFSRTVTTQ